ncbi:hypothetical protein NTE_03087 [Candidatus Nitrososphaera evergladensis SR1]|uniref:Uncharacterized protein n=1 Tax=Candidatus Nitrososphaera evergladensis SR1 TaxID=1459636 RepID=A0A075MTY3_9ARCH|nr:hypothetical protein [Candidatus Nitrososphaera evergladensis]AIF85121.1 hypothetical protein NTE_03087 [Candidatus Nitrososphaera evergladensis SR1]
MTNPTEAATFRFDKTMLDQLRVEAEQKQINLNTLLNQIVRSHIEWHANAARAGFIPIRRGVIKRLFDLLTKEQIDALAADVSRGLTDETMMIMTSERTEETIYELLERWIRISGFNYRHEISEDARIFVIQHNMGENWSHYISRLIEYAASEFTDMKPETQVTENALFIRIRRVRH